MNLPIPVQAYFDADKQNNGETPIRNFLSDATVMDEGRTYSGQADIEKWWRVSREKYHHVAEPLEYREEDGLSKVRARVTGEFLGSPAVLTFAFRLKDDRIRSLEICA